MNRKLLERLDAFKSARRQTHCNHLHHRRLRQRASSIYGGAAVGSYYKVGVFDAKVTCGDCGKVLNETKEAAPLCRSCFGMMQLVHVNKHGQGSCSDPATNALLSMIDVNATRVIFQKKVRHDAEKYDARKTRVEEEIRRRKKLADEKNPPKKKADPMDALLESMRESSLITARRGMMMFREQVYPYVCTASWCDLHGKPQFLETPGD